MTGRMERRAVNVARKESRQTLGNYEWLRIATGVSRSQYKKSSSARAWGYFLKADLIETVSFERKEIRANIMRYTRNVNRGGLRRCIEEHERKTHRADAEIRNGMIQKKRG